MQNIILQRIILFFVAIYFLVVFWPVIPIPFFYINFQFTFLNSSLPGQLIPLLFIVFFSIFSIKKIHIKSNNVDLKIVLTFALYILFNAIIQAGFDQNQLEHRAFSLFASLFPIFFFYIFFTFEINNDVLNLITKYLFFGLVIYSFYYFDSVINLLLGNNIDV